MDCDGRVGKSSSTLTMRVLVVLVVSFIIPAFGELISSCMNCRWNVIRESDVNTKVIVEDNSEHKINWKWDVKGGHWNVTYNYKYPDEYYSGKAVFVNSSVTAAGTNAFVSWGSSVPWMSNAVPIYSATPWNITYNGDTFGFVPTKDGRYIFRVFTKNKRHDPFAASEPLTQPCALSATNTAQLGKWWQDQKVANACPELGLTWTWPGKSGKWTVFYRYADQTKKTNCEVFYESPSLPRTKLINWELDELQMGVSYATNPVLINENGWQVSLSPAEVWGFTPTGNGLWVFQHFSRNLVFQPFANFRSVLYPVPAGSIIQPNYQTVQLPPVVTVPY